MRYAAPVVALASILLLALGLSADATAVAAALGARLARVRANHLCTVTAWFGLSQGGMALFGSLFGRAFGTALAAWDHWIAFGLLAALGGKMLWEARGAGAVSPEPRDLSARNMLPLAVATSVDALAVGVTLPLLGARVLLACALITLVTALNSAWGLWAGRRFGALFGRRVDALGGLVLILLGIKILFEHLRAA